MLAALASTTSGTLIFTAGKAAPSIFEIASGMRIMARRGLGVTSFGYAAFHTIVYLECKIPLGRVVQERMRPELLTGWIAFFIFIALALTSNNISVRKLGENWQLLHRTTYAAATLTALHWGLATLEYVLPIIFVGRWVKRKKTT